MNNVIIIKFLSIPLIPVSHIQVTSIYKNFNQKWKPANSIKKFDFDNSRLAKRKQILKKKNHRKRWAYCCYEHCYQSNPVTHIQIIKM